MCGSGARRPRHAEKSRNCAGRDGNANRGKKLSQHQTQPSRWTPWTPRPFFFFPHGGMYVEARAIVLIARSVVKPTMSPGVSFPVIDFARTSFAVVRLVFRLTRVYPLWPVSWFISDFRGHRAGWGFSREGWNGFVTVGKLTVLLDVEFLDDSKNVRVPHRHNRLTVFAYLLKTRNYESTRNIIFKKRVQCVQCMLRFSRGCWSNQLKLITIFSTLKYTRETLRLRLFDHLHKVVNLHRRLCSSQKDPFEPLNRKNWLVRLENLWRNPE